MYQYLSMTIIFALMQLNFGEAQNRCVREIRALKGDLQNEIRGTVRETIMSAIECATREETRELIADKATKIDVYERNVEVLQFVNNTVSTGNELILDEISRKLEEQKHRPTKEEIAETVTNSTKGAIREVLQAVVHDELQSIIRQEVQSVLQAEIVSVVRSVVQTEIQSVFSYLGEIQQNNTAFLSQILDPIKENMENNVTSCRNLTQNSPEGIDNNTNTVSVCPCGSAGKWKQVVYLNMTDPNHHCPSGLRLHTSPRGPRRTCGRVGRGCSSTIFPVHGVEYSKVCGKVIGYQFGRIDAFTYSRGLTIDDAYAEGVSITHGTSPRKHIWTLAVGHDKTGNTVNVCPCNHPDQTFPGVVPPFIGQDYFCESGNRIGTAHILYTEDPLWDGMGCEGVSSCCDHPPYFCKQLPQPTTDDIELRMCGSAGIDDEDSPLEIVKIFIQ